MSDTDRLVPELEALEIEHQRERRIWWIDRGMRTVWPMAVILSWNLLSYTVFSGYRPWFLPFLLFILGVTSYFLESLLDHLFNTGRRLPPFGPYALKVVIVAVVITAIIFAVVFAASKTADLLF